MLTPYYRVAGMGEPWSMHLERTYQLLGAQGIGAILTLTEDDLYGEKNRRAGFVCHHEPIDDCEPPTAEGMDRAVAFIDDCLEKGLGVAVHCFEGRGRTGTVLGGWIGLKEALDPEEAAARIFKLRTCTILTPSQRSFLYRYLREKKHPHG